MTLQRGDVGLVRFPHTATAGGRGKKRPVVVVQVDVYNARLNHAVVAEVTTNLAEQATRRTCSSISRPQTARPRASCRTRSSHAFSWPP
jgi:mRNA-degrading endonuclease toxin of MazEF toxin-antitoxin module